MNVITKQVTGQGKTNCEDILYVRKNSQNQEFGFAGIADGQGNKRYCLEGGEASLEIIADYMKRQNLSSFSERYLDEVQYELIHTIRQKLGTLAKVKETEINEFSSTLCCIAYNKINGDFIIIHLGDGCILGLTVDDKLSMMSSPENGITRFHTYLTTSPMALTHMRLSYGNLIGYKAIYLMSNGADCIFRDGVLKSKTKSMLWQQDFTGLSTYIENSKPRDDASFIMIQI